MSESLDLIVTTKSDLREIIRDAVIAMRGSLSCFRRSRWRGGLTSVRTPCGNGLLAMIAHVYVRGVRFGFGRTR
jgi:hypothetical protein